MKGEPGKQTVRPQDSPRGRRRESGPKKWLPTPGCMDPILTSNKTFRIELTETGAQFPAGPDEALAAQGRLHC